jgi:hypothetical protein
MKTFDELPSLCINSLAFLLSTKETQLMKLCWQPKRKKQLAAAFLKRKLLNHEVTLLYIWYKAGEEGRAEESES